LSIETRAQEFRVSNSNKYQSAEEVRENIQGMAGMGAWECGSMKVRKWEDGTGRNWKRRGKMRKE
jgi:hypothetical protein